MKKTAMVLAALALCACGMTKAEHESALDEQKKALTTEWEARAAAVQTALDAVKGDVAKMRAEMEAAKKAAADAEAKAADADAKMWKMAAVGKVREAQIAVMDKKWDAAAPLVDDATKVVKEKSVEPAAKALDEAAAAIKKKDAKAAASLDAAAKALLQ